MKLLPQSGQRCSRRGRSCNWVVIYHAHFLLRVIPCITEAEETERAHLFLRSSGYNRILCSCSVFSPERTVRAGAGWSRPRCSRTRPASPAPIGPSDATVREAESVSAELTRNAHSKEPR